MSNTGSALLNRSTLYASGDLKGATFWADKAMRYMRKDLTLPDHIEPCHANDGKLQLSCDRCRWRVYIPSMASAAMFRDRHFYCGEQDVTCTLCPHCERRAFPWETECRVCQTSLARKDDPQPCSPHMVLKQWATFRVRMPDGFLLATITCNTLLQAQAAAERMLPNEGVIVEHTNHRKEG